jgi:hypothetical protein
MLIIAIIGLFVNFFSMIFLHRDSKESLNVKASLDTEHPPCSLLAIAGS